MDLRLSNGDRVCIVGGGPAGSFAALHLLRLADRAGLSLQVSIFEPRDFSRPGPGGCNRCAGILSSRAIQGLESLGLTLPAQIVQSELRGYTVYLDGREITIEQPDAWRRIASVYRGGGPRLRQGEPVAGFDGFLLSQAVARGARHISQRVRKIHHAERPIVETAAGETVADLLVLATGVNSRSPLAPDYQYKPPRTAVMAQDEVLRPPDWPDDRVGTFFKEPAGLLFGALIPKGKYLSISLLGRSLTLDTVSDFADAHDLGDLLGNSPGSLCGCTPRIATHPAPRAFGDRWVAVGDAAVTRLYKDGIGSAYASSQAAAGAAIHHGISQQAFKTHYAPHCRQVATDNLYGRFLFRSWAFMLRRPALQRAWISSIEIERELPLASRIHHRILWGMFTGDEGYRSLFWRSLHPHTLMGLVHGWWRGDRR